MTNIFLVLSAIFSTAWVHYNYELQDYYIGESKTEVELLQQVNKTKEEIDYLRCDNPLRGHLFTKSPRPNFKGDSLQIIARNKKIYSFTKKGITFKGKKYRIKRSQKFLIKTVGSLNKLNSTPTGFLLLSELMIAHSPIIITKSQGAAFYPKYSSDRRKLLWNEAQFVRMMDTKTPHFNDKIRFKFLGSGGKVLWDKSFSSSTIEEDGIRRKTNSSVVLAHELYHAYDSIRGLLDTRIVKGSDFEYIGVLEYRATYLENLIRKELGYKYRKFYGDVKDQTKPGLLNEDGTPKMFPSSCISWL